jgi:peroxiredoxin
MSRRSLIVVALVLFSVLVAYAMSQIPFAKGGEKSGKQAQAAKALAPDFTLEDLNGKQVSLSDHRGKFVFLHFWATWCPPCKDELPAIQKLYEVSDQSKFAIMTINVKEGRGAVQPFLEERRLNFPVQLDARSAVSRQYRIRAIPTTILIDQEGLVVGRVSGARDWRWEDFEPLLK